MIHLDTHVVVWLYGGQADRLPAGVRARLSTERTLISPMVLLELRYLHEVGRIKDPAAVLSDVHRGRGLALDATPFADVVATADRFSFTRDAFDRLIAAQAVAAGADLVTKDRRLREHLPQAVWD